MQIHTTLAGHEVRYEVTDEVDAFLKRVRAAVDDAAVSGAELLALVYSAENPILDTSFPGRPRVTKAVLENPVYDVLQDLIFRKDVAESRMDVEQIAARYSVTVQEAAKELGVQPSSIIRAIQAKRLASWMKDGRHYVDPAALEQLEGVGRRGPKPAIVAPLEYRVGRDEDRMVRIRLPGDAEPDSKLAPVEGSVDRWRRVGVLHGNRGKLRFFVLEPDAGENEIRLEGLYVRGRFRVVERVMRSLDAQKAWAAFRAL